MVSIINHDRVYDFNVDSALLSYSTIKANLDEPKEERGNRFKVVSLLIEVRLR